MDNVPVFVAVSAAITAAAAISFRSLEASTFNQADQSGHQESDDNLGKWREKILDFFF